MRTERYTLRDRKVVIRIGQRLCEDTDELVKSEIFRDVLAKSVQQLRERQSYLLGMFETDEVGEGELTMLYESLKVLVKMPIDVLPKLVPGSEVLVRNRQMLFDFSEHLYNYWRSFDRFIICDSRGSDLDHRPYRTFNDTIEQLTHLVRKAYRDVQENITGEHPDVYRQVGAGANVGAIAVSMDLPLPERYVAPLGDVLVTRQVLLNPPLVLDPPMNKRKGNFEQVQENPIDRVRLSPEEYICYPAKVGPLNILVYVHERFYELGFSLANLFDICSDEDLTRKPDGVFVFGAAGEGVDEVGRGPTVFHEDRDAGLICATVPLREEFGYFGYLKKMMLTIHNVAMMRRGKLPFHGSLTRLLLGGERQKAILLIGDSGAGKSETLEAFRELASDAVSDIIVVADDMGSLQEDDQGRVIGYGTEIGAFLRLDDLSPSTAFGQIDRAIFMSPGKTNTRIVIPVTTTAQVLAGTPVDLFLYANNYEEVDDEHPILERFEDADTAFEVFRRGRVMSKGTTADTGIVESYFANIFGPPEHVELHDQIARQIFERMFASGVFVGQLRTRLGIPGFEFEGPLAAAKELAALL